MRRFLGLGVLAITLAGCAATYPDGSTTKAEYDAYLSRRIHDPDYEANHAALEARVAAETYSGCGRYVCW